MSLVGALAVAPDEETRCAMTRALLEFYERGLLEPSVTKVHPFEEVPAALTELEERRVVGKHVIHVSR